VIALLQRVRWARVEVDGRPIGAIDTGLLVFAGVERDDGRAQVDRIIERMLGYRIFPDGEGKMNRSVQDVRGGVLLVSQFTLAADTHKGMRPSFTPAATPDRGAELYDYLVRQTAARHTPVRSGQFGAHMDVSLLNDGPVTFLLRA
jgi:D-tyrosyl-tRNA(Tyr) deacylase